MRETQTDINMLGLTNIKTQAQRIEKSKMFAWVNTIDSSSGNITGPCNNPINIAINMTDKWIWNEKFRIGWDYLAQILFEIDIF